MSSPYEDQYKYCPNCSNSLERKEIDGKKRLYCYKCNFTFWNNPKPCVSVILSKDKKVLLLQRSKELLKDYWVLPGGYLEYDEKPEESIIREVKEETSLNIKIEGLVSIYLIDNDPRGNTLDSVFFGKIFNGEIRLKEHSRYKFYSPNDLPDQVAYKHREALSKYFRDL